MKQQHLVFIGVALMLGLGLFLYSSKPALKNYPGSSVVFKKYYPENEILGMTSDNSWHSVSISPDSMETINSWYNREFSPVAPVENGSDAHCTRKSFAQSDKKIIRVTICNQGDYRTILTVIPK